jgi:hypothetical protein
VGVDLMEALCRQVGAHLIKENRGGARCMVRWAA